MVGRLETISLPLSEAFHRLDDAQKRRAVHRACEIAVKQAGLHGEAVDSALAILSLGGSDEAARFAIEALSERFDDEYFRLQSVADRKTEALLHFRKARAAAALGFALSPAAEGLGDALYEAIFAFGDRADLLKTVEMGIS